MRLTPSCIAALELLQRGNLLYIHFNDEASSKG
jgi:hypothetical protein